MRDFLLPATDAGVLVQLGGVVILWLAAVIALRNQAEWRLVAIGAGLVALGLIGVRALH